MADKFRALLVTKDGDRQSVVVTELTDADLMNGDVDVAVEHSTVNYKDGLATTGKASIIRKFPLIPGIDLAGRVLSSEDPRFHAGDRVVLNGYGLGEVHHGAIASSPRPAGPSRKATICGNSAPMRSSTLVNFRGLGVH